MPPSMRIPQLCLVGSTASDRVAAGRDVPVLLEARNPWHQTDANTACQLTNRTRSPC
jgi:hypothetical protein